MGVNADNPGKFSFVFLLIFMLFGFAASALSVNGESSVNANIGGNSDLDISVISEADADGESTLTIAGTDIKTNLEINASSGSQVNAALSNAKMAEIKIMPSTASETAIARIRLNVCSEENNCTIEIKEVSSQNKVYAVYEVKAKKEYKVLGLFKARGDVEADVDVETGIVVKTSRPWWAVVSTEVKGNAASQISA